MNDLAFSTYTRQGSLTLEARQQYRANRKSAQYLRAGSVQHHSEDQREATNPFRAKARAFAADAAEIACLATFAAMIAVWAIILGA